MNTPTDYKSLFWLAAWECALLLSLVISGWVTRYEMTRNHEAEMQAQRETCAKQLQALVEALLPAQPLNEGGFAHIGQHATGEPADVTGQPGQGLQAAVLPGLAAQGVGPFVGLNQPLHGGGEVDEGINLSLDARVVVEHDLAGGVASVNEHLGHRPIGGFGLLAFGQCQQPNGGLNETL